MTGGWPWLRIQSSYVQFPSAQSVPLWARTMPGSANLWGKIPLSVTDSCYSSLPSAEADPPARRQRQSQYESQRLTEMEQVGAEDGGDHLLPSDFRRA